MKIRFAVCMLVASIPLSSVLADNVRTSSPVVKIEDIHWGYLNPLRGDKSPAAAELWGDRNKSGSTGMLVRFKEGFSSPPHIHNVSYRGIVIEGMVHNDDPETETMWMPTGSFWTQPAGQNHITAASGESNLIYLEIDSGLYLVKPAYERFDNGERPINVHASNLAWFNNNDLSFIEGNESDVVLLWGSTKQGEVGGSLVKLPAGFTGKITTDANEFRAVVIKGGLAYAASGQHSMKKLLPGSYFGSVRGFEHGVSVGQETIIYIRTDGSYSVFSN